MIFQVILYKDF